MNPMTRKWFTYTVLEIMLYKCIGKQEMHWPCGMLHGSSLRQQDVPFVNNIIYGYLAKV